MRKRWNSVSRKERGLNMDTQALEPALLDPQAQQCGAREGAGQTVPPVTSVRWQKQPRESAYGCGKVTRYLAIVSPCREEPRESLPWRFPKFIHHGHALHARNCAVGGARFDQVVFAFQILTRVLFQRNTGITALLRAVVDETVFTNIEVATPSTTMPVVGSPFYQIFIKTRIKRRVIEGLAEI